MKTPPYKCGLAIHIEPARQIELPILLKSLGGIGQEYSFFAKHVLGMPRKDDSKLYVGSVKPGSIDVLLQPEFFEAVEQGLAVMTSNGPVDATKAMLEFGQRIGILLDKFKGKPNPEDVSIKECDNAINIANNTVEAGGTQTINMVNFEGEFRQVYKLEAKDAFDIVSNAIDTKALLTVPTAERRNSVALTWQTFDNSPARTEGAKSPDKGIIEEIENSPKSILFIDDETGMKSRILTASENPMHSVYFVDVEVVRVKKKIIAYRIVGFKGQEPLSI
ncbi:MAG: hypothetical protein AAGF25_13190 [Pseudomonadota bacterium]